MKAVTPTYSILDEPKPAAYSHLACNPFWIFLATLLGGVWIGWTWSALNSLAIGSSSKKKELALIVLGILGSVLLALWGNHLVVQGVLQPDHVKYAITLLVVWKLAISYVLHLLQDPSFQLHEYFGGKTRNGLLVLVGAMLLRPYVLGAFDDTILFFVLA